MLLFASVWMGVVTLEAVSVPTVLHSVLMPLAAVLVGRGVEGQQAGEGAGGVVLVGVEAVVDWGDWGLTERAALLLVLVLVVALRGVSLMSSHWSFWGFLRLDRTTPWCFLEGGRRVGVTSLQAGLCMELQALTYGDT